MENVRGRLEKEWGWIAFAAVEDDQVRELAKTLWNFDSIGVHGKMFVLPTAHVARAMSCGRRTVTPLVTPSGS